MSFTATGTPASGPSSSPRARAASTSAAAARAVSEATQRNDRTSPSSASIRRGGRRSPPPPTRPRPAPAQPVRRPCGRSAPRRALTSSSARIRGTRNRPSSAAGAMSRTRSRSSPGRGSSGRSTLASGMGCDVGGTSDGVEGRHRGSVLEDGAELDGELLDLRHPTGRGGRAWRHARRRHG